VSAPEIHFLADAADPRLGDYRALKDHLLKEASGKFIAESELCVRKLLASPLEVRSLLLTAPHLARLEGALRDGVPVYVVPQEVVDGVAGFHVHRGCLAVGVRPAAPVLPADARTVVVLEDLVDVDNLGAMARNAAAFGADALVLSPRCADPFYRKAVRVSMGSVFFLPIVRAQRWPEELIALREQHGLALVGAVLDERVTPLERFVWPARAAVILGSEGPGLREQTRRACDHLVTIPMAAGRADSLNVATAGAVFLYARGRAPVSP
jgi:tRNA G18 (ribose-2'-O)-methylase SpoU